MSFPVVGLILGVISLILGAITVIINYSREQCPLQEEIEIKVFLAREHCETAIGGYFAGGITMTLGVILLGVSNYFLMVK